MSKLEAFDATILGERLRNARSTANLTQDSAASSIGISRTTLVSIERGERRVRPHELTQLAELYKTTVSRLVSPTAISAQVQGHFRANAASSDARELTLALLLELSTGYVEIERALGDPLRAQVILQEYPAQSGSLEHAEDAAMYVRTALGLGMSPVGDLLTLAEVQLGLRIFVRPLESRVSGAYIFHEQLGGCVVINAKHPRPRRLWTLAHEIGHFVGERRQSDVVVLEEESHDRFADAFAGALLMPPAALRRYFQSLASRGARFSPRDLILMAHEYGVSTEAMCRWLERLRLLPAQTYEALRDRGFDTDVVRSVVGDPPKEATQPVPPRLLMIATEAHRKGILTEGRLANLLGIDRLAAREMLDGVPSDTFDELA